MLSRTRCVAQLQEALETGAAVFRALSTTRPQRKTAGWIPVAPARPSWEARCGLPGGWVGVSCLLTAPSYPCGRRRTMPDCRSHLASEPERKVSMAIWAPLAKSPNCASQTTWRVT